MSRHYAATIGWRPKTSDYSQNSRAHWAVALARKDRLRNAVRVAMLVDRWPTALAAGQRYTVTFTVSCRRGPLPDSDNLAGCLKTARDTVAKFLGVDDSPSGPITWRYVALRGPDGVLIELEEQ